MNVLFFHNVSKTTTPEFEKWSNSISAESSVSRQPDGEQPHGLAAGHLSRSGEKHFLGDRTIDHDDVVVVG